MYVIDTATLIDLHRHFAHDKVRKALVRLVSQGELVVPEGVRREIERKTDAASKTLQKLARTKPNCIVHFSSNRLRAGLARIEKVYGHRIRIGNQCYPGFWQSASGRKAADGQVVAVAKDLGGTAVSDDKAIQRACLCENVPCIGWTEFARVCVLVRQGKLF